METKRLIVRKFTEEDFDRFFQLMADPEVMRFSLKGPLSLEEAKESFEKRILEHYEVYGFGLWMLIEKETEEFIGVAGLISQQIDGKEEVELAYRLFPKHWNKGFATEACAFISQYAFGLGIAYLISIIDPLNERSLKVAKKVGMVHWKDAIFHGTPANIYKILIPSPEN